MSGRVLAPAVVALLLVAGCQDAPPVPRAVAPTVVGLPDDPSAPRLRNLDPGAGGDVAEQTHDGDACARMGQGRSVHDDGSHRVPADETDDLRLVFAARTDVSSAVGYREDGGDTVFFCTGFRLREDSSGASSATIPVPTDDDVEVTVAGSGSGYGPGENVVDYFGWAASDVAAVVVRTPDGTDRVAAVQGNVWWAAPVVDASVAARSTEATWRALDASGRVLAQGGTRPE
jgi:hypothetical protein